MNECVREQMHAWMGEELRGRTGLQTDKWGVGGWMEDCVGGWVEGWMQGQMIHVC